MKKIELNYKKFVTTVRRWSKNPAGYGLSDLIYLAYECHTPIPKNVRNLFKPIENKVVRIKSKEVDLKRHR